MFSLVSFMMGRLVGNEVISKWEQSIIDSCLCLGIYHNDDGDDNDGGDDDGNDGDGDDDDDDDDYGDDDETC